MFTYLCQEFEHFGLPNLSQLYCCACYQMELCALLCQLSPSLSLYFVLYVSARGSFFQKSFEKGAHTCDCMAEKLSSVF